VWSISLNLLFLFTLVFSTLRDRLLLVIEMIFNLLNFNDDVESMYQDYSLKSLLNVHQQLTKFKPFINHNGKQYKKSEEV
jgi:hypothetical protein